MITLDLKSALAVIVVGGGALGVWTSQIDSEAGVVPAGPSVQAPEVAAAPLVEAPAATATPSTLDKHGMAAVRAPSGDEIWVDPSIAGDVQRLVDDAAASGVVLGGWGHRTKDRQIELRVAHCGWQSTMTDAEKSYVVNEKPSGECHPPTARPGKSMHEVGKAIDFTVNGKAIGSRNTDAFRWLDANAANYGGLKNLPSEPWHWSTNGR